MKILLVLLLVACSERYNPTHPPVKYVISSGKCWSKNEKLYYSNTFYFEPFRTMEDCLEYSRNVNGK